MEIFTKVTGKMIWPMEWVLFIMQMALFIREDGLKINKEERALKNGEMVPLIKEHIKTE